MCGLPGPWPIDILGALGDAAPSGPKDTLTVPLLAGQFAKYLA